MPYITQGARERVMDGTFHPMMTESITTTGELNFAITALIDEYIASSGGVRYAVVNDVVGALECAKLELYRRVAAPYEDRKLAENGDVYTCLD
jgi:hypothetical protein